MFFNFLALPFKDAYCRGLSGWKRICSDSGGDIIETTNQCFETLDEYLSAKLCPITDENARSDLIALFNDLVEKKRLLESISWLPEGLTSSEEAFYHGDVCF